MKDERLSAWRLWQIRPHLYRFICARSLLLASSNAAVLVVLDFGYKFTQLFPTLQISPSLACENLLIFRLNERKFKLAWKLGRVWEKSTKVNFYGRFSLIIFKAVKGHLWACQSYAMSPSFVVFRGTAEVLAQKPKFLRGVLTYVKCRRAEKHFATLQLCNIATLSTFHMCKTPPSTMGYYNI